MRTYDCKAAVRRTPGLEDAADLGEHAFEIRFLLLEECADVPAGRRSRTSELHNLPDLRQRQAQPASLLDKRQQAQDLVRVLAIATVRPTRRREDAAVFIDAKCLSAHAATPDNLTGSHEAERKPGPLGPSQVPGIGALDKTGTIGETA